MDRRRSTGKQDRALEFKRAHVIKEAGGQEAPYIETPKNTQLRSTSHTTCASPKVGTEQGHHGVPTRPRDSSIQPEASSRPRRRLHSLQLVEQSQQQRSKPIIRSSSSIRSSSRKSNGGSWPDLRAFPALPAVRGGGRPEPRCAVLDRIPTTVHSQHAYAEAAMAKNSHAQERLGRLAS